jgi:hypothetical protein
MTEPSTIEYPIQRAAGRCEAVRNSFGIHSRDDGGRNPSGKAVILNMRLNKRNKVAPREKSPVLDETDSGYQGWDFFTGK